MEHSSGGEAHHSPGTPHAKAGSSKCYLKREWSVMLGRYLSATSEKQTREGPGESTTVGEKTSAMAPKWGEHGSESNRAFRVTKARGYRGGGQRMSRGPPGPGGTQGGEAPAGLSRECLELHCIGERMGRLLQ